MRGWLFAIAAFVTVIISNSTFGQESVRVGIIGPLSGPFAGAGTTAIEASRIKVDALNAEGGVAGRKLELIVLDTACNPAHAMQSAATLVQRENVDIAVEFGCGGSNLASGNVFQEEAVPHLVYGTSDPGNFERFTGIGSISNSSIDTLVNLTKILEDHQQSLTELSTLGYVSVEIVEQAIRGVNSSEPQDLLKFLKEGSFLTSAGDVTFVGAEDQLSNSSSFSLDLWTEKKDCPKCPKAGACPQSLEAMIVEKKTCN